ncbi:cytochrome P450 [Podospora fimiseda]|uniref:Cytochrome P450 n=1 Tax=Podospora fimiseda TaxID=252190 RepID=A0AAN7BZ76_9PEZI|nr:cytochrome P450 [Podospora fimiseda]
MFAVIPIEKSYYQWNLLPIVILGLSIYHLWDVKGFEFLVYGIILWFIFLLQRDIIAGILIKRLALELGYGPLPVYPALDHLLGLDTLIPAVRAIRRHRLLDWFYERRLLCGKTYWGQTLGEWVIMTSDPKNIQAVLSTKFDDWKIGGPRLYATLPALGHDSIFTTNGEKWEMARRRMRPAFNRNQVADLKCFERHVRNFIEAVPGGDGVGFDVQGLLQDMTMDSSTDFLLGYSTNLLVEPSAEARQMLKDFDYVSRESSRNGRMGALLYWLPHPFLYAAVGRVRKFVGEYMDRALEESKRGGEGKERGYVFLDALLEQTQGQNQSRDYIIDQMLSILVAGRDTTATAITAAFYFLARDAEVVRRLREEIESVGEWDPSYEQLHGMKYMKNVVREALRLFPPVATNSRISVKDTPLPSGGGPYGNLPVIVRRNTPIRYCISVMHRDRSIYGDDADVFRPERWEVDETIQKSWIYLPFNGGPRVCLGQQFALTQIYLTLYRFFQTFESIEHRDGGPLLAQTNLVINFPYGCKIAVNRV